MSDHADRLTYEERVALAEAYAGEWLTPRQRDDWRWQTPGAARDSAWTAARTAYMKALEDEAERRQAASPARQPASDWTVVKLGGRAAEDRAYGMDAVRPVWRACEKYHGIGDSTPVVAAGPSGGQRVKPVRQVLIEHGLDPERFKGDEIDRLSRMLGVQASEPPAAPSAPALDQLDASDVAMRAVLAEVRIATAKFPTWPTDPLHALAVLGEEFGELTKAVVENTYEPDKCKRIDVEKEALQTAAMAIRFLMSLYRYEYKPGEQHEQQTADKPAPAPAGALTDERHGLDTDERVCFYEQEFYVLSNFSSFSLEWRGLHFPTSEAAYQWEKFYDGGPESRLQVGIRLAGSAHEAFKIAERAAPHRRRDWDSAKVDAMRKILRAKVEQHEYVRRKLMQTGDRELVENSWRDSFWGWGPNRDGENMLGKLWMELRGELRALLLASAGERSADK